METSSITREHPCETLKVLAKGANKSAVLRMRMHMYYKSFSICWEVGFLCVAVFALESSLGDLIRDPCCPLFALIPLETCSLHASIPPQFLPRFPPISDASGTEFPDFSATSCFCYGPHARIPAPATPAVRQYEGPVVTASHPWCVALAWATCPSPRGPAQSSPPCGSMRDPSPLPPTCG